MLILAVHVLLLIVQAEKTGEDPKEAKTVKLYMQLPPIEKMDAALSTLVCCEWVEPDVSIMHMWIRRLIWYRVLSLSSNCIEKITNLNGMSKTILILP